MANAPTRVEIERDNARRYAKRLEERVAELEAALAPFARPPARIGDRIVCTLLNKDLIRARKALGHPNPEGNDD